MPLHPFSQIADNITVRVEPADTDLERYVGLEHLDPESLKLRRWGSPSDVIGQKLKFWKGDIIYGKRRAYQRKLVVADFDGICSAHAMVLRAKPEVCLPEFLPFFLQSDLFHNRALEISVGSLSPTINWTTLAKQEFPLPPVDEQRRIADLLWAADNAIQEYHQVHEASEKMISSLLMGIFSESKWKSEKLDNHVEDSLYGPRFSNTLYSDKGLVACIRTTDLLSDGTIIYSTVPTVDLNPNDFKEHLLQFGDFMISRSGTCGIASVFEGNTKITIPGAFLIRLRLKQSLNPIFLREYINSPVGQLRMGSLASGGVQKNIRGSLFLQENIPVPDIQVQEQTVEKIRNVRNVHKEIAEHIEKLKQVKYQLLQTHLG